MTWGGQESLILGKDSASGGGGGCETPSCYRQTPEKLRSGEMCAHPALLGASPSCQRALGAELARHQNSQVGGSALHPLVHHRAPVTALHLGEHSLCFSLTFCKLLLNWVMAASSPRRGWLGRCSPRAAFAAAGGSRARLPMALRLSFWSNGEKIQVM